MIHDLQNHDFSWFTKSNWWFISVSSDSSVLENSDASNSSGKPRSCFRQRPSFLLESEARGRKATSARNWLYLYWCSFLVWRVYLWEAVCVIDIRYMSLLCRCDGRALSTDDNSDWSRDGQCVGRERWDCRCVREQSRCCRARVRWIFVCLCAGRLRCCQISFSSQRGLTVCVHVYILCLGWRTWRCTIWRRQLFDYPLSSE